MAKSKPATRESLTQELLQPHTAAELEVIEKKIELLKELDTK